jgi:hypothetical protein
VQFFYPIYNAEEKKHNGNQCCELQALEKDVRVTVSSSTRSAPEKMAVMKQHEIDSRVEQWGQVEWE